MGKLAGWGRRLGYLVRRTRLDHDLLEELEFHVDSRADELMRAGLCRDEAIATARRELGSPLRAREESHAAWQIRWLEDFAADSRYALRVLRRNPAFAVTAILTLALGIGANTAIFSIVDAVLLKPLPYDRPGAVMILNERTAQFEQGAVSYPNFLDWRDQNRSFERLAVFRGNSVVLNGPAGSERLTGRLVSGDFFGVLGVRPAAGRLLSAADDKPGAAPAVVISHRLWQNRFAGDPGIAGRAVTINDDRYTVVGVAPAAFWFYTPSDVFLPIALSKEMWVAERELRAGLTVVGRLKPGVTRAQALADMNRVARSLAVTYPKANAGHGISIAPILSDVVGTLDQVLYLLLGAVGFVLLVACANVGNLLLARSTARRHEMALRAALGAGGGRVVRQLLTESLMLAAAGGALGLLVVASTVPTITAHLPDGLPRVDNIGVDWRVLLFIAGLSALSGLAFGLLPALRAVRASLRRGLNERDRTRTPSSHRLQDLLVTSQVGLALLLVTGATLMMQSVQRLWAVDPGFDPRQVLTFNVWLSPVRYDSAPKARRFYADVLDRLTLLPGVTAAAISTDVPFRGDSELFFHAAERPRPDDKHMPWAMFYPATAGYARAMGLTLLRGRFFTEHDTQHTPAVVVVDDALARGVFGDEDAVGKHLVVPFPGFDQPREIVGVVRHVKHWGLSQDDHAKVRYQFYMPFWQIPDALWREAAGAGTFLLRASGDMSGMVASARAAVGAVDKDQPVYNASTMPELIAASLATERLAMWLLGAFAMLAAVLAAVGTYGVTAYTVARRTNEIGVRIALGADGKGIMRLVLAQGARAALAGVGLGVVAALALTRLLSSLLFKVSATDPVAYALAAALLLAVSLVASALPARRALRIDPTVALRTE